MSPIRHHANNKFLCRKENLCRVSYIFPYRKKSAKLIDVMSPPISQSRESSLKRNCKAKAKTNTAVNDRKITENPTSPKLCE